MPRYYLLIIKLGLHKVFSSVLAFYWASFVPFARTWLEKS